MTRSGTSHLNRWLHFAALAWVIAVAALEFSYVTADPDLWGHIYFGADHWQTGDLRRTDLYSFTANRLPWINHEWLAELIFFLIYNILGGAGLLLGKLLLGLTVVLIVWRIAARQAFHPLIGPAVFAAAVFAMKPGFMIRPQLFSFLLFIVELAILHAYRQGRHAWMAGLPIMMALWVNLHGGFLMGGLLAAIFILAESRPSLRSGNKQQLVALWGWGLAGALATLLNPYGIGLHRFLAYTLSLPRSISEWAPVPFPGLEFTGFKILVLFSLAALWVRRRNLLDWEPLAMIVIGTAAFCQQRHMVFFAILATPFLVDVFSQRLQCFIRANPKFKLSSLAMVLIGVVFFVAAGGYVFKTVERYHRCGLKIIVNPEEYPLQAMAFLKANEFQGNLLVSFNWGEFAIWHLYPKCKVSIDGRFRTVYPQNVIDDHFIKGNDADGWQRTLSKYPADILLVPQQPFFQNLIQEKGPWVYVYSDSLSIIFVRDMPHNRIMIDRIKQGIMQYSGLDWKPYFPG
jgi:hypothetical protein